MLLIEVKQNKNIKIMNKTFISLYLLFVFFLNLTIISLALMGYYPEDFKKYFIKPTKIVAIEKRCGDYEYHTNVKDVVLNTSFATQSWGEHDWMGGNIDIDNPRYLVFNSEVGKTIEGSGYEVTNSLQRFIVCLGEVCVEYPIEHQSIGKLRSQKASKIEQVSCEIVEGGTIEMYGCEQYSKVLRQTVKITMEDGEEEYASSNILILIPVKYKETFAF